MFATRLRPSNILEAVTINRVVIVFSWKMVNMYECSEQNAEVKTLHAVDRLTNLAKPRR